MSMRLTYSRLVSAAIAAAAVLFIYGSLAMPIGSILPPAAGMVPLLLGCATLALAIAVFVGPDSGAAKGAEDLGPESEDPPADGGKVPRPLLIMIVLGLVILGFERAGFILTLLGGIFVLLRFIEKKPLPLSLMISLALSIGLYLLFSKFLYVSLPGGWLEF